MREIAQNVATLLFKLERSSLVVFRDLAKETETQWFGRSEKCTRDLTERLPSANWPQCTAERTYECEGKRGENLKMIHKRPTFWGRFRKDRGRGERAVYVESLPLAKICKAIMQIVLARHPCPRPRLFVTLQYREPLK